MAAFRRQPAGEQYENGDTILLDMDDKVAHVIGSSRDKSNWKKHWTNCSGRKWPAKCQTHDCGNAATVGAHVYIKNVKTNKWYFILPTCQACNKDTTNDWGAGDCWEYAKKNAVVVATPAKMCCFE